jgi:hypothetical protein
VNCTTTLRKVAERGPGQVLASQLEWAKHDLVRGE